MRAGDEGSDFRNHKDSYGARGSYISSGRGGMKH